MTTPWADWDHVLKIDPDKELAGDETFADVCATGTDAIEIGGTTGMTAGKGWIAIALVIFAAWRPWRALVGAYLFGGIDVLVLRSQALDLAVGNAAVDGVVELLTNPQVMSMYPYLATVLVLVLASRGGFTERAGAPTALLDNYSRELD